MTRLGLTLLWPVVAAALLVIGVVAYLEIVTRPVADSTDDAESDGRPARPGGGVSDGTESAASASLAAPLSASHMASGAPSGSQRDS